MWFKQLLHICVNLLLTTSARLIFQTEPILLQAVYRYICVNICTKFTERLRFFLIGLLDLEKKITVSFYSLLGYFLQDGFNWCGQLKGNRFFQSLVPLTEFSQKCGYRVLPSKSKNPEFDNLQTVQRGTLFLSSTKNWPIFFFFFFFFNAWRIIDFMLCLVDV